MSRDHNALHSMQEQSRVDYSFSTSGTLVGIRVQFCIERRINFFSLKPALCLPVCLSDG